MMSAVGALGACIALFVLSMSTLVEAQGWVKLEQTTKTVLSTQNVAVMLMPNGTIWAADLNKQGRIDEQAAFKPMVMLNGKILSGVVEVVAGEGHVLARRANGEVWAAGDNTFGQLGAAVERQTQARFVPCVLANGEPIRLAAAIVAGRDHSIILLETGVVMTAGSNQYGQLGQGDRRDRVHFAPVVYADGTSVSNMVGIEAKEDYTLLLRQDDTRWLAGRYPKLSIKPSGKIVTYDAFIEF
jgi:alpha-tubulin suppressor-like RCC1 family protein